MSEIHTVDFFYHLCPHNHDQPIHELCAGFLYCQCFDVDDVFLAAQDYLAVVMDGAAIVRMERLQ